MSHSAYIILADSNKDIVKRFRVIQGGYVETVNKAQSRNETVEGGIDIGQGGIYTVWRYLFRVYHTDPTDDTRYGTLADLRTFYLFNNPNGSPTNVLTLTDHYGTEHSVYFMGNLPLTPLNVIIEGEHSQWHIPVELHEIP